MNEVEQLLQQIKAEYETVKQLLEECPRDVHQLLMAGYARIRTLDKQLERHIGKEPKNRIAHQIYMEIFFGEWIKDQNSGKHAASRPPLETKPQSIITSSFEASSYE